MNGFWGGTICAVVVVVALSRLFSDLAPLDDTDDKVTARRSDMRVLIDHGTGCQYLRTTGGGLTPRLDKDGKPICKAAA